MNNTFFSSLFHFYTFRFEKYHHTDHRAGSPHHYLAYIEMGHGKIISEKGTIEIHPGDVFYIPKGLSYQSFWTYSNTIILRSFGFDYFPEDNKKDYALQIIPCGREIAEQLKSIPTDTSISSSLLGAFYSVLAKALTVMQFDHHSHSKTLVDQAIRYINTNPGCKIPDIAKHCLISESGLYSLFKKETGVTPNDMRQRILCKKAVMLLTTTDRSVLEISDMLGFSSTSYFRKVLYQHTGKTPREIRETSKSI